MVPTCWTRSAFHSTRSATSALSSASTTRSMRSRRARNSWTGPTRSTAGDASGHRGPRVGGRRCRHCADGRQGDRHPPALPARVHARGRARLVPAGPGDHALHLVRAVELLTTCRRSRWGSASALGGARADRLGPAPGRRRLRPPAARRPGPRTGGTTRSVRSSASRATWFRPAARRPGGPASGDVETHEALVLRNGRLVAPQSPRSTVPWSTT